MYLYLYFRLISVIIQYYFY